MNKNNKGFLMQSNKLGDFKWMQSTQGKLSTKDKIYLFNKAMLPTTINLIHSQIKHRLKKQPALKTITLEQIPIPDTLVIKESIAQLNEKSSQAMINHSWRTYFWSAVFGILNNKKFNPEILLTASLLHSLGLAATHLHSKGSQCFTFESAKNFERLAESINYPQDKAQIIKDAICMHLNGYSESDNPIEVTLLQYGASCDVTGERFFEIPSDFREELLATYPRENFNSAFKYLIKQETSIVKNSRLAFLNLIGLPIMVSLNPFKE